MFQRTPSEAHAKLHEENLHSLQTQIRFEQVFRDFEPYDVAETGLASQ